MRRTNFRFIVLATLFVTVATSAPALLAQTNPSVSDSATLRPGRAGRKAAPSNSQRKAGRKAGHVSALSDAHRIGRRTEAAAARRRHETCRRQNALAGGEPRFGPSHRSKTPDAEPETEPDQATTAEPEAQPKRVSLTTKRIAMPPPLRGSYDSLERQNEKAEAEGLERIEDEEDLADRIVRKMLVPVPASAALSINGNLPVHHRYCRPWTARFAADLARAHAALFHGSIEVSSAVRTVEYQKRLMEINGNAAAAEGQVVSPHLTGATIDIAKSGMSRKEIGWMRSWLLPLQKAGKIDVEEEFQQSCFHITVYKSYEASKPASKMTQAKSAQPGAGRHKTPQPKLSQNKTNAPAEMASLGR